MRSMRVVLSLLLSATFLTLLVGCDDDESIVAGHDDQSTCVGCHASEQMLKATALPDPPPPEDEGEG
jgi:hypothetical protein